MEDIKDYKIIEKLGQGAYGTVFKVLNKKDNNIYIIKQILLKHAKLDELQKESNILSKIKSDYIVKYYASFVDNENFNIVMEYCDGLDLRKFIEKYKNENKKIDKSIIYNFIIDLCLGLKVIHNSNLIHRDLKPENIFIDKYNKVKIGDFGISIKLENTRYAKSQVGTFNYMAPEILKGEKYNNKADIWALGCVIYELCTLNYCFDSPAIFSLINKIINEEHEKIDIKLYPVKLQNLIDLMLNKNYKNRPNIEEVYEMAKKFIDHKNEIKMKIEVNKDHEINKNIYFFSEKNEILKELNDTNCELYINDKKYKFCKYFKCPCKGIFNIKLIVKTSLTDCSYLFSDCRKIIEIDLSSFNTENVTKMNHMFNGCRVLKNVNLTSLITKNTTDMSFMFATCEKISNLNLDSFVTEKVTNMEAMFSDCYELAKINLSHFNTENVINMSGMFHECCNLINIDLSSFNTKKVINMRNMFYWCSRLKNIYVKSFNTENVTNMYMMFKHCRDLKEIDLSSFNTEKVTDMGFMFCDDENLEIIDLSTFNIKQGCRISCILHRLDRCQKIILNKNLKEDVKKRIEFEIREYNHFNLEIIYK